MPNIRTATQQPFMREGSLGYREWVEKEVYVRWRGKVNWETAGEPLYAIINGNNWDVFCDICSSGLIAEPGEPFFCPNCENSTNGFKAREVIFPENRREIEKILLKRPNPDMRSWQPPETADDLLKENLELGIK